MCSTKSLQFAGAASALVNELRGLQDRHLCHPRLLFALLGPLSHLVLAHSAEVLGHAHHLLKDLACLVHERAALWADERVAA